ncbi:facilitated trehalose transporter Tret1-like [Choristoneura fumiferana]|uniref:facilitated trehalose transporter Tret1-like n=1 Tax=Choristoneura fumiferana TaxID=7141 RepID=UPI003D158B96
MKSEKETTKKGHTYVQWAAGIIANSIAFTYAMQACWISPVAKVLQSKSSPTGAPLSDSTLGWVASALPITAFVFVPIFSFLADKYGRKTSILIMAVPQTLCWVLKLYFASTTSLVIARVCSGIAAGGCFNVVPMYNKEISQDNMRGAMGSLLIVACNMGILIIFALGAYVEYYTVLYIVAGIPVLTFILMLKCPESPGYLVKIGKYDEALQTLAFLRGLDEDDKSIQNEVNEMKKDDEFYKTMPPLSMIVILKDRAWRKAFIIAALMNCVQTLSGNFALVSYGVNILKASGVDLDAELMTLTFPAVMLAGSFLAMVAMERVGRKVLLLAAYLVSAASLAAVGVVMQQPPGSVPAWLLLAAILGSMVAFSCGVMPVPYIVMSELFNIQIRATLMGFVAAQGWGLSFALLAAFAPITAAFGMYANFYFFAAVQLLGFAAVLVLMPETRGKSIEQLETELKIK